MLLFYHFNHTVILCCYEFLITFLYCFNLLTVLERKISMRATREELIKRGVLLPDYDTIKEEMECHTKKSNFSFLTHFIL